MLNMIYTILNRDIRRRRAKINTRIESKDEITLIRKFVEKKTTLWREYLKELLSAIFFCSFNKVLNFILEFVVWNLSVFNSYSKIISESSFFLVLTRLNYSSLLLAPFLSVDSMIFIWLSPMVLLKLFLLLF